MMSSGLKVSVLIDLCLYDKLIFHQKLNLIECFEYLIKKVNKKQYVV